MSQEIGASLQVRDLIRAATAHGAVVTRDDATRDWKVYQVEAPSGKLWTDGSVTALRVEWQERGIDWHDARASAIRDAIARMQCGLEESEDA